MDVHAAVDFLRTLGGFPLYGLLFSFAIVEYVFPPFPGDTVTVAGAALVAASGLSAVWTLVAVVAGGVMGGLLVYGLGFAFRTRRGALLRRIPLLRRSSADLEKVEKAMARYGDWLLVVNRFMPGVRSLVFVAAGLAGIGLWRVTILAVVSGLLWNAMLVAVGVALGANLDAIERFFRTYTAVAWGVVALAAVTALAWWAVKRMSRR